MSVSPVPDGYTTVTPYLIVEDAPRVLEFLKLAFGADVTAITKLPQDDGRDVIMNAEVRIGTSMVMVAEARGNASKNPTMLYLYVDDVDTVYQKAIAAGGKTIMEPADMPYGDRSGAVEGPSGNSWWIASRIENLSEEEITRRMIALNK